MESEQKQSAPTPLSSRIASIGSTVALIVLAPVIAVLLTIFVFQSYEVSGQSMEPTLHNKDRLIIWKVPRTWSRLTGHPYIPARGDVVVVRTLKLAQTEFNPNEQIIKRVIGLPGDRVVVKDKVLTIYNAENPDGFQPEKTLPYGSAIQGTSHDGEWTVATDQLFICGDNRYNSTDSRVFGSIQATDVVGKLVLRLLPITDLKPF